MPWDWLKKMVTWRLDWPVLESDRGNVITDAAFLDDALKMLLETAMKHFDAPTSVVEKLLQNPMAPLSSFSSRLSAARAFGLIDDELYDNLELIRDVRNLFAHHQGDLDFSDDGVKRILAELKSKKSTRARRFFLDAPYPIADYLKSAKVWTGFSDHSLRWRSLWINLCDWIFQSIRAIQPDYEK